MYKGLRTAWFEAVRLKGQLATGLAHFFIAPKLIPIRLTDHQNAPMKKVK